MQNSKYGFFREWTMKIKIVYLVGLIFLRFVQCWGMLGLNEESGSFVIDYPLHHAAENGDLKEVKKAIRRHQVNKRDVKKNTPLHYAKDPDVIRFLVNRDAHVNARNRDGKTALHFAVDEENEEGIEILIEAGAKTNIEDADGITVHGLLDEKDVLAKHIQNADDREKRKKFLKSLRKKLGTKAKKKEKA